MSWLSRLFGKKEVPSPPSPPAQAAKGVAPRAGAKPLAQQGVVGQWMILFGPDTEANEQLTVQLAKGLQGAAIIPVEKAGALPLLTGTFAATDTLRNAHLIFNHHVDGVAHTAVANDVANAWSVKLSKQFEQLLNQPGSPIRGLGLVFDAKWSINVSAGAAAIQFHWPSIPASALWHIAQLLEDSYARGCPSSGAATGVPEVPLPTAQVALGPGGLSGAVGPEELDSLAKGEAISARILDLRSKEERQIEAEAQAGVSLGPEIDGLVDQLVRIGREEEFLAMEPGGKFDESRRNLKAREIGTRLNDLGGKPLMQAAYYRVRARVGGALARELESAWGYIGSWMP